MEVFQWDELNDESPWKRYYTNGQTDKVLFSVKSVALCNNSTNLNHADLCDPLNHPNDDESGVAKEVSENILFVFLNLSSVDLIEQLQENENLEYKCEVNNLLCLVSNFKIQWCVTFKFSFECT